MNDASRGAFEAWASPFAYSHSEREGLRSAWHDAWQASRKQALEEYEAKLQTQLDHAAINDHRMAPPFGRVQGEPGVRAGSIEAVIEFMKASK